MSFKVQLLPSGKEFVCDTDETVLTAALRAGITLPYGCKNGACGSCKGTLKDGLVDYGTYQAKALPEQEKVLGKLLLCCARPESDLQLSVRELSGIGDIPVKKMPSRVNAIARPANDVAILKLQLPANDVLQFLPGQYLEFLLKDGKRRAYSIANAPHEQGGVELHIRHMPGGLFTDHVFNTMKERDILRFEGPLGTFFLREDSAKPIVFLASGTGFAPIKSMIEHAIHKNIDRPMVLYWGARQRKDMYMAGLAEQWQAEHSHFRFVPVLSEPSAECNWQGRTGLVHYAVMQDFPSLAAHQVYACGVPIMVESAKRDFVAQCGLPEDEFFADAFTSEADNNATA
jgi:CDP-4-dehydro-6-deoxyglucose reductase